MSAHRSFSTFALLAWMGLVAPCGVAWAQAPTAEIPAPRFDITRFDVVGNTLLKPEEIQRAVAPYTGKQKDFSDIQRALEAVEQTYRRRGYGTVQVLLPEQDIASGIVRLNVTEPRIGKVNVEGNKYFNDANIRASLPGLRPGATPNSQQISRNLQLLSEHPAKQTTVLLKPAATENEVDATIKVIDEKPLKFVATLDNSGTDATGRFRAGIGMQYSNLFNRDHIINLQYVTNPENTSKVKIFGAGYRIPFYAYNSSLDLFAGYADVNSGTLAGLFNVSGSGTIFGGRYNLYLPKIREYEHKLAFGLDYRAFQTQAGDPTIVPDVTVHPASLAYNGLWRMTNAELGFYVSYSQNVFPGGNDGADSDFKASRFDARAGYRIWRGGVNYTRVFAKDWQFRAVVNGQYSEDALITGEQFAFGGPDSVRGFLIREVPGDKGYAASVEVYTPELGSKFGWSNVRVRLLGFYDMGTTSFNSSLPGQLGQSGASVGIGARVAVGKHFNLRVDFAQVVDAAGNQAKNDQMLNAAIAVPF